MSVKDALLLVKQIQVKWTQSVVNARPGEQGQLQPYLGLSTNYASVSAEMTSWSSVLTTIASKPRVSQLISKSLVTSLRASLSGLNSAIDQVGNSVDWMCANRQFGAHYALSIFLIRQLQLDSARETVALVDAAKERIAQDLGTLQAGTAQATSLIELWPGLSEKIATIEEADESVTETVKKLNQTADTATEKVSELQESFCGTVTNCESEISESTTVFRATLKDSAETLAEASKIQLAAKKILEDAEEAAKTAKLELATADASLKTAIQQEEVTQKRLTKALQNAQMEGLAGSFTRMASDSKLDILSEEKKFRWALVWLVIVALIGLAIEVKYGFSKDQSEFTFRLIRTLSLAAPAIWVAWMASKKLNALNRVFSDYQYKSASALAYESYRQSVENTGSEELKLQLLAFAIRSFGENPTHYYDAAKNEAASPGESWIEKLPIFGKSKTEAPKVSV